MVHAQIDFTRGGVDTRLDASDVTDVSFETVDRVRVPASWKHKRNYEGFYWAATTGAHVWFESLYERAALMRLDRDREVLGLAAQPMWIHWSTGGGRHAPDFFARYGDARTFFLTAQLCAQLGWGYEVISDITADEHRNLRFLSGYRYDRWVSEEVTGRLYEHARHRLALSGWATILDGVCAEPLGAVYSALWWGALDFDIQVPLSLHTWARAV